MIRRGLDALYAGGAVLAALSLFGIFLVMVAQMGLRFLGMHFPGSDDISAYLCVATTFLALALTFRRGELIRVGLLIEHVPPGARRGMEILALSLAAVACAYAIWWMVDDVLFSLEIEDVAQGELPIPLWIPKLTMPIGAGLLLVAVLDELVTVLRRGKPSYVLAAEARAARGDYSVEG
ncbi:TRAP-type C4-dicarboxylate transport system, small permease component [Roseomonas rosea]|uniref:TRAP transporter small permease protein n=1 Tax=Muricoccus roseus TaxID=198092 RepID=A0A1M6QRC0_9PROT|nr:TRAP transporter small permease [Roseomonas rosea]SHK22774.1 TRAP-type C4-dicarboxylate transport system, small permease component [Roseomonas rosea]